MFAIVAPGQGAQKPGFLAPWLELPGAAEQLAEWSEAAELDLAWLGTEADAETIRDTAHAQPLLVAAGLLAATALKSGDAGGFAIPGAEPDEVVLAGHSVGEITAAAIAGAFTPREAVAFAARRGRAMAAACELKPTGMSAIVGGDHAEVLHAIDSAGLYPANYNAANQVVAAGELAGLARLGDHPPPRARVIPLAVAGAFHTPFMGPALTALSVDPPRTDTLHHSLLSNLDGTVLKNGPALGDRLIAQVTAPVRWDLCMATLARLNVDTVIELPPAGTLAGLIKRGLPDARVITVNTPADLR